MPKWIVSLRYSARHFCGGTILSSSLVLSASHCFTKERETWVVAGSLDLLHTTGAQMRKVIGMKQVSDRAYENNTHANDIVLVKVDPPFEFDDSVGAADLPSKSPQEYAEFQALGWGVNEEQQPPPHLMEIDISFAACEDAECPMPATATANFKSKDQFCAAAPNDQGPGVCYGDSGGPVVAAGTDIVVGISSNVEKGCQSGVGRFTDVYQYVDVLRREIGAETTYADTIDVVYNSSCTFTSYMLILVLTLYIFLAIVGCCCCSGCCCALGYWRGAKKAAGSQVKGPTSLKHPMQKAPKPRKKHRGGRE